MSQASYALPFIFEFEREQLFAALRRDYRAELEKFGRSRNSDIVHFANARNSLRLLEALNPKRPACAVPVQRLEPPALDAKSIPDRQEEIATGLT